MLAPPRTRGWTHGLLPQHRPRLGSPAHAGMDLSSPRSAAERLRLPRARGDGPL